MHADFDVPSPQDSHRVSDIRTSKCVVSLGWISPGGNCTAVKDVLMLPLRAQGSRV